MKCPKCYAGLIEEDNLYCPNCGELYPVNNCYKCKYSQDYGESVLWIRCEKGKKRDVMKTGTCSNYSG